MTSVIVGIPPPPLPLDMKTTWRTATFGPYTLDLHSGELRKFGTRVNTGEQALQILLMLLENPGEMVTREELRSRLWPENNYVDFDHGLNSAVQRLRDCLSDSAAKPRWIETIPRRGYRFVGQVDWSDERFPSGQARPSQELQAPDGNGDDPFHASQDDRFEIVEHSDRIAVARKEKVTGSLFVVAIVALASISVYFVRHGMARKPPEIHSLAVLPLANLSGDSSQDYLADGMTEELITELGKSSTLQVISRTSVMQYKGTKKPVQEIARELNVDAVLEGTVLRSGNHLRITANLVQSSPETHLWAETYDSESGDILGVQQRVADSVAREIRVALSPRGTTTLGDARPVNPEAQDLYFRGLYAFRSAGGGATQTAVDYLQRAIKKDPIFARAYAVLAMAYAVWYPGDQGPRENMPRAREAALKAVALDDSLAAGHMALAYIDLNYDWNFAEAESESKRALELDPNFAVARNFYARELVISGRTDEALVQVRRALELQPYADLDYPAWVFYLAHRYDDSLELARKMVGINPNFSWGRWALAANYEQLGKEKEAAEEYLEFEILSGSSPQRIKRLREGLARSGAKGFWQASLEDYLRTAKSSYVPPVLVAGVYMRLGDKARALQWLEKGYQERDDLMIGLNVDPVFDASRSEPRFQDLVRRVALPEGKPKT